MSHNHEGPNYIGVGVGWTGNLDPETWTAIEPHEVSLGQV